MHVGSIKLSEIKTEKHITFDFTHMWNLINKTKEQNKKRQIKRNPTLKY